MSHTNILLESGTNELEVVEFYLDEPGYRGHYGINVAKVVEIIRPQPVTAMPQMPHPCIMGAFPYRDGRVVPLVDLAKYLGTKSPADQEPKVVITEFNKVITAFQVSGVNRIYRLSWTDVEAPGLFLQASSKNSITGVVRLDGRVVFLLDMESIVDDLHPGLAVAMQVEGRADTVGARPLRLLHADDSGSIRRLMFKLLTINNRFELIQAMDGQQAWDILTAFKTRAESEQRPITDFVEGAILDIEMPRMDGLTLCKQIKQDNVLRVLPVAIFSSLITETLRHKGQSVGADTQFAKPDLQSVSDKMFDLIEQKNAAVPGAK
ncbi:MAG: chemotaxis protein [Deltaproteobacteria bacterium]|jgi:two-component system chemotaxis response regulator CheV|nr:chemotaxis protein [Deltaproteobacteria bacterium]